MITIRINGETTKIKTFDELSVSDYITFRKMEEDEGKIDLLKYLSVVLDTAFEDVLEFKVNNIEIINNALGELKDYRKHSVPKELFVSGEIFILKGKKIQTLGHRFFMTEYEKQKPEFEDYLCYMVALLMADELNADKILNLKNKLLNLNYLDVLSTGNFFLDNFLSGLKLERNVWKRLILALKTKVYMSKQVLTG